MLSSLKRGACVSYWFLLYIFNITSFLVRKRRPAKLSPLLFHRFSSVNLFFAIFLKSFLAKTILIPYSILGGAGNCMLLGGVPIDLYAGSLDVQKNYSHIVSGGGGLVIVCCLAALPAVACCLLLAAAGCSWLLLIAPGCLCLLIKPLAGQMQITQVC